MDFEKQTNLSRESTEPSLVKNTDVVSPNESHLEREQDVVISGISCRLPKSQNMAEFAQNLLDGTDMTSFLNEGKGKIG